MKKIQVGFQQRVLHFLETQATKNPMAASYDVPIEADGRLLMMRVQPTTKRRLAILQVVAYDYPRKGEYRIITSGKLRSAAFTLFMMRFHDDNAWQDIKEVVLDESEEDD